MAEEFQESEVIWADQDLHYLNFIDDDDRDFRNKPNSKKTKKNKMMMKNKNSIPVDIPQNVSGPVWIHCLNEGELSELEEDGEMIPPHVILSRRLADKMAFSVCTGNGRTLKGRDLSQVRNSILRMTGFLET